MKIKKVQEVDCCDECNAETYVDVCLICGTEHCYDCKATHGVRYNHSVYFRGTEDGYYCNKCLADPKNATNETLVQYRAIENLRLEEASWYKDFTNRYEAAEAKLKELIKK